MAHRSSSSNQAIDILNLPYEELLQYIRDLGYPAYRGRQLWEWLYQHCVRNFDEMHTLPAALRTELTRQCRLNGLQPDKQLRSRDGTSKLTFTTHDGHLVEGVLIPNEDGRLTACISSQIGCSLRCSFCATARIPFRRNLTIGEIIDQVVLLQRTARREEKTELSNIVFMGMGEPLANYQATVQSLRILTGSPGFGLAAKRITLSTVGLIPEIRQLAREGLRIRLAVSLHTADPELRRTLISAADRHPLPELADALREWYDRCGVPVTLEYLLLAGCNDSTEQAEALIRFASRLPCKINIIEYNPVAGIPYTAPAAAVLDDFAARLAKAGLTVTVRRSGGKDIEAACGQLAGKNRPGYAQYPLSRS